ncbi:SDR family NAD(P)-dependent oxidoreductase [Chloroflexota bacterium]
MNKFNSLRNKVVVITGAAGGLGRTVTNDFAKQGAKLILVGRKIDSLATLGKELDIPQENWIPMAVDLFEKDSAQKLMDAAMSTFGSVDILVHLVGGWMGGKSIHQVTEEEITTMLEQHLWTTFFLSRVFVPRLIENKWGRIIVVSSPNAEIPPAKGLPYSVSKSAQEALMLTLAAELKGSGVTANIIQVRSIVLNWEHEEVPSSKKHTGTSPSEISAAILYLSSQEAGNINGARIPLYGNP